MGFWPSLATGVVGSLLAFLVVALWIRVKEGFALSVSLWLRALRLQDSLSRVGFRHLYATRSDYARLRGADTLGDYLGLAKHRALIVSLWMAESVATGGVVGRIRDLILERPELRIDIALAFPDPHTADLVARYMGTDAETVSQSIIGSLCALYEMRRQLPLEHRGRLGIRAYDSLPAFSTIVLDPDDPHCRVQVDFKVYHAFRGDSFSMEFQGADKSLVARLTNAARRCYDSSSDVEGLFTNAGCSTPWPRK